MFPAHPRQRWQTLCDLQQTGELRGVSSTVTYGRGGLRGIIKKVVQGVDSMAKKDVFACNLLFL